MNFLLEMVIPAIVLGGFFAFLIYQILRVRPKKEQSGLYHANSTNSGTKARKVFETIKNNSIQPDYLGEREPNEHTNTDI